MCTVRDVLIPRFGQIHAYVYAAEPTPISMVVSPPRQPEAPRQEQHSRLTHLPPCLILTTVSVFWGERTASFPHAFHRGSGFSHHL